MFRISTHSSLTIKRCKHPFHLESSNCAKAGWPTGKPFATLIVSHYGTIGGRLGDCHDGTFPLHPQDISPKSFCIRLRDLSGIYYWSPCMSRLLTCGVMYKISGCGEMFVNILQIVVRVSTSTLHLHVFHNTTVKKNSYIYSSKKNFLSFKKFT